jgi:hypothetical protein
MSESTPTPLESTIADLVALPQSTTVDGTTTTERPIADLVAADQHVEGNKALRKRGFGILRQKMSRGDALGGHR